MNQLFFQTLLGITITGAIIITANIAQADLSPQEEETGAKNNLVALQFETAGEAIPGKDAAIVNSVRLGVRNHCSGGNPRRCRIRKNCRGSSRRQCRIRKKR